MGDFSGLGALGGGLLGGLGGGSRPAGTTTTTTGTTSIQDLPDWLKPYVMGNLNSAQGVRDSIAGGNNGLMDAAVPEYLKTIRGDYLDPASNPFLDQTYKHAADLVGSGVDSRFSAAGRYGSGAHQGVLQEGLNNLANSIYGGNYQAERSRQVAATGAVPSFDLGSESAALYPYTAFNSLIPQLRNTTGTGSATTPYFTNPSGNILSGALLGGQLGGMFGGGSGAAGLEGGAGYAALLGGSGEAAAGIGGMSFADMLAAGLIAL